MAALALRKTLEKKGIEMPALIFFTIILFMVYRGYCFSLNTQLARAGIPQQAKWQGFLFLFQLGKIPIKFEFQSF